MVQQWNTIKFINVINHRNTFRVRSIDRCEWKHRPTVCKKSLQTIPHIELLVDEINETIRNGLTKNRWYAHDRDITCEMLSNVTSTTDCWSIVYREKKRRSDFAFNHHSLVRFYLFNITTNFAILHVWNHVKNLIRIIWICKYDCPTYYPIYVLHIATLSFSYSVRDSLVNPALSASCVWFSFMQRKIK